MLFLLAFLSFLLQSEAINWGCRHTDPVCGTDGVTYKDICEFNNAKTSDQDLQILYEGSCLKARVLKGPTKLKFRNIRPNHKTKLDQESKKYFLHFRTFTRDSNEVSLLDNCPEKCEAVCPHDEDVTDLHYTRPCLDCCNEWRL